MISKTTIIGAVLLSAVSFSKVTSVRTTSRPTVRTSTFKSSTVKTTPIRPTTTKTTTIKPKVVNVRPVPGKIVNTGTNKKTTVINNVSNKTTVVNNINKTKYSNPTYESTRVVERVVERNRGLDFWDYMMLRSIFNNNQQSKTVVVTQPSEVQQVHSVQPSQYVEQPLQRSSYDNSKYDEGLPWLKIISWMLGLGSIGGIIWLWRKAD